MMQTKMMMMMMMKTPHPLAGHPFVLASRVKHRSLTLRLETHVISTGAQNVKRKKKAISCNHCALFTKVRKCTVRVLGCTVDVMSN